MLHAIRLQVDNIVVRGRWSRRVNSKMVGEDNELQIIVSTGSTPPAKVTCKLGRGAGEESSSVLTIITPLIISTSSPIPTLILITSPSIITSSSSLALVRTLETLTHNFPVGQLSD